MQIDLNAEVAVHFKRLTDLADEAASDNEQGFQSRSAAMSALTSMLSQLTKTQESLITMERLQKTEEAIIRVTKEFLGEEQLTHLIEAFERELARIE